MQRERELAAYDDREALYHLRPGVWISPKKPWTGGGVELLEIPSDTEANDNIAAYWCPATPPQPGESLTLDYRVAFGRQEPMEHIGGRVVKTNVLPRDARTTEIVIRFAAGSRVRWPVDKSIEPVVSSNIGSIRDVQADADAADVRTVRFLLVRDEAKPAELRCFLRSGTDALTETWSYLCS
ncbi:MAG: glucan biosynthesis protein [Pirellulales bacterium]